MASDEKFRHSDSLNDKLESQLASEEFAEIQGSKFTFDGRKLVRVSSDDETIKSSSERSPLKGAGRRITFSSFSLEERDAVVAPYQNTVAGVTADRKSPSPYKKTRSSSSRSSLTSSPSTSPRITPTGVIPGKRTSGRRPSLSLSRSSGNRSSSPVIIQPPPVRVPSTFNLGLEGRDSGTPGGSSSGGSTPGTAGPGTPLSPSQRQYTFTEGSGGKSRSPHTSPPHSPNRSPSHSVDGFDNNHPSTQSSPSSSFPTSLEALNEYRRKFVHEITLDSLPKELVESFAMHMTRRSVLDVEFEPHKLPKSISFGSLASALGASSTPSRSSSPSTVPIPTSNSIPKLPPLSETPSTTSSSSSAILTTDTPPHSTALSPSLSYSGPLHTPSSPSNTTGSPSVSTISTSTEKSSISSTDPISPPSSPASSNIHTTPSSNLPSTSNGIVKTLDVSQTSGRSISSSGREEMAPRSPASQPKRVMFSEDVQVIEHKYHDSVSSTSARDSGDLPTSASGSSHGEQSLLGGSGDDIDRKHTGEALIRGGDRKMSSPTSSPSTSSPQPDGKSSEKRVSETADLYSSPIPSKVRGILKTKVRQETVQEVINRIFEEREQELKSLVKMRNGSLITKYGSNGKPLARWVYVSDDGTEISWRKPTKEELRPDYDPSKRNLQKVASSKDSKHDTKKKTPSKWPTFRLWNLKINASRTRSLIDVIGVHYGPYASDGFQRYLQQKDRATGYPWLCVTIEFVDRTLDLVCKDTQQVTSWFLGIQALAPLSVHYLSKGAMLWQRLIMLLNFHGFDKLLNPQFPWIGQTHSESQQPAPSLVNDLTRSASTSKASGGSARPTFLPTVHEEPHGVPSSPNTTTKVVA